RRIERRRAERLHGAERRIAGTHPDQAGESHLLRLIDEHIELTARVAVAARHRKAPDRAAAGDDLLEHPEFRVATRLGQSVNLEAAAQIGLVGAVAGDRLRIRHPPDWQRDLMADLAEDLLHQRLDQLEDGLGARERYLHVDLRELELPVGALVLVAEAADD